MSSQPALRIVEGSSMDEIKGSDRALSQIERQFARARLCGSARTTSPWKSMRFPRVRSVLISRSASAACRVAVLLRSTALKSSGKTTLALHCVAEAQKKGGICAFIDAEHALDPIYARKPVSMSTIFWSRSPTMASRRWKSATPLVRSGAVRCGDRRFGCGTCAAR